MAEYYWNPWHGCHKYSPGCMNCYVYRRDESVGRDASVVTKNANFEILVKKDRHGEWKIPSGSGVMTCFTSDFLLEDADPWRVRAWEMIAQRRDLNFFFITKRITRLAGDGAKLLLPPDWGENGYPHVSIGCTCENQQAADKRLPVFLSVPIHERTIILEPLLAPVDLTPFLDPTKIVRVAAGGESGEAARPVEYAWILALREQCRQAGVPFTFRQTGANFIKDGRAYRIPRKEQMRQARRAGIDLP